MKRSDMDEIEALIEEDPSAAVELARKVVGEIPGDADAWCWLAEAQVEAGEAEGALASLAAYVERDPDWLIAYTMRAELLAELGRFEAAAVEIAVARAMDSEDPQLLRTEAFCKELGGDFPAADELWRRAAEVEPGDHPPVRFDRARARQAIERVLRDIGKEGLKLKAVFEEVPKIASPRRLLSRSVELRDAGTVVVYFRNLERDLDSESTLQDLADLFEDRLAALVEAN